MRSYMPVGIDDISFYTTNFSLDLQELADNNGSNAAKYTVGIGQERMSVPGADEDVVTMAANACLPSVSYTHLTLPTNREV